MANDVNHGQDRQLSQLRNDLQALGLKEGDTVLARAATQALGREYRGRKGAILLTEAILSVIGDAGTLIGLSFTPSYYRWQKRAASSNPFTVSAPSNAGGFARVLLDHPSARRSLHPTNSFVSIGMNADFIVEGHDDRATCFAPIAKLLELNGKLLLVGCTEASPGFSTVHYAQEQLSIAHRSLLSGMEGCAVQGYSGLKWFWRRDVPGCSMGFSRFYEQYRAAGLLKEAKIGEAESMIIDARNAYALEYGELSRDPNRALCLDPGCISCGTRTYAPGRMLRMLRHRAEDKLRELRRRAVIRA